MAHVSVSITAPWAEFAAECERASVALNEFLWALGEVPDVHFPDKRSEEDWSAAIAFVDDVKECGEERWGVHAIYRTERAFLGAILEHGGGL